MNKKTSGYKTCLNGSCKRQFKVIPSEWNTAKFCSNDCRTKFTENSFYKMNTVAHAGPNTGYDTYDLGE